MPRTFSRGKKFTAAILFDFYDHYLTTEEQTAFEDLAILRICQPPLEPGLKEQEILDQLLGIKEIYKNLQTHFEVHHGDDNPHSLSFFVTVSIPLDKLIEDVQREVLLV